MKKKFFKLTSDSRDISRCIFPDLSGATTWIEAELDELDDESEETDYTITIIWMTQEEFENIPEYEH
jgi:hypothetical protein